MTQEYETYQANFAQAAPWKKEYLEIFNRWGTNQILKVLGRRISILVKISFAFYYFVVALIVCCHNTESRTLEQKSKTLKSGKKVFKRERN